jgi:amino acid transporter
MAGLGRTSLCKEDRVANLLATKPLKVILDEAHETGEHSLRRALGPTNLITLGIGAIIGTGIFVLTGTATALHAGPAIVLSFALVGVSCVFAGLCYAEFASMIPVAGSAYTYGYATLGEIFAWIIGWDLVLEYAFGAATVASGWSGYFISLLGDFGIKLPAAMAGTHWDEFVYYNNHWENLARIGPKLKVLGIDPATLQHTHGAFNLLGFLAIVFCTLVLVIGIRESATFNSTIVLVINQLGDMVNIGTLLAFAIVCGGVWVIRRRHPELPRPFRTPWVPLVPILGIVISVYLMYNLPGITWLRLVVWLVLGMFVYFGYGRSHSRVQRGEVAS